MLLKISSSQLARLGLDVLNGVRPEIKVEGEEPVNLSAPRPISCWQVK